MVTCEGLEMPDLRPYFKHLHWRAMPHSIGVPVASDFADYPEDHPVFGLYKRCGLWTQAEAAILYNSAKQVKGEGLDIGGHTGWTAAHLAVSGCEVTAVDPMYSVEDFCQRAVDNLDACGFPIIFFADTSREFSLRHSGEFDVVVIDGDHMSPNPLGDAQLAECVGARLILFHDAIGEPVQEGVRYLISRGFHHKVYWTPHVVAVCWRGEFVPPEHTPDANVQASVSGYYRV